MRRLVNALILVLFWGFANADTRVPVGQLPDTVRPNAYRLSLDIDPAKNTFTGRTEIDVELTEALSTIFLHGNGLRVRKVTITAAKFSTTATYEQVDETGVAQLTAAAKVPRGRITLAFEYEGSLSDTAEGLFRANVAGNWYAWTQMAPIDARRMFPCFDEPRFKTPFTVSVTAPTNLEVFANSPELERTDGGAVTTHHFQATLPLPTYLVALAVGPFEVRETMVPANDVRSEPLPFRVIATKGQGPRMEMALTHGPRIVALMEEYFQIPHPYEKLDFIGTPILGGAMENAGLVVYDDAILLLDETAPFDQLRTFAEVVAHEVAHQWFGNLVTPTWWTDVWLSESFAEWLGKNVAHQWRPELGIAAARLQDAFYAMTLDALPRGRPVREAITENTQINSAFDAITYRKGAQVLAMFENYVGADTFANALRLHLNRFRHGTASSDDFFKTLSEVAQDPKVISALKSFVDQTGIPLVSLHPRQGTLALAQERFRPLGVESSAAQTWIVPVCVSNAGQRTCTLLSGRTGTLDVQAGGRALMPNADGAGYYRFRLDAAGWDRLIAAAPSLSGPEALALADSVWSEFAAGSGDFARVIAAAKVLSTHSDRLAVLELGNRLRELSSTVLAPDQLGAYQRLMQSIYSPRLQALGLDLRPGAHAKEAPQVQALRQSLLPLVALEGRDPVVRAKLGEAAEAYLQGGTTKLDPAFRAEAFAVAVQDKGIPFMRALRDALVQSTEPLFREQAIVGLAAADTPELARAALDMSLSKGIHSLETARLILGLSRQPLARDTTIDFVARELDRVLHAMPTFLRPQLSTLYARSCAPDDITRVEAFIRPKLAMLGGGELELEQAKQRIRLCAALKSAKKSEIAAALGT
jgi:aminopeptidase N